MSNYKKFFGHGAAFARRVLAFLFWGKSETDPRFEHQPQWLRKEMLDKAIEKRRMRAEKRLRA